MKMIKGMFKNAGSLVRNVALGALVLGGSSAAMAAEGTPVGGFDIMAFLQPVVDGITANVGSVVPTVATVFALYWGATTGIQIVKKFLSKVAS